MATKRVIITDVYEALKAYLRAIIRPIWLDHTDNSLRVKITNTPTFFTNSMFLQNYNNTNTSFIDPKQSQLYAQDRASWEINVRSRIS